MSEKLRVLYVIDSLKMGGAERITVALLPFLTEIEPIVCELYHHESPLIDQVGDVKLFHLRASRLTDFAAFRRFLKVLKDERIDVIHAQLQHATVFAALGQWLGGVPYVATRHIVNDNLSTFRARYLVRAENAALKRAKQIIYVSNATSSYHQALLKMPTERYMTIYNGIKLDSFQIDRDKKALAQELGFPIDKPLVCFVGVFRPGKGHLVAFEAAKKLPHVNFLFVGDNIYSYANVVKEAAKGIDNVILLGTREDVPVVLNAVDMLILPSDMEALPTVLIEAGAAGLPSIATNVGGVTEIVTDGETGIIIPPQDPQALADAIQRLIDNPDLAQKMGKKAFERIQTTFTLHNQARQLTNLYKRIAEEAKQN